MKCYIKPISCGRMTFFITALLTICSGQVLSAKEPKVLNIYNWEGYFGETTLIDFAAETGIKINYDTFDSGEVMETRLLVGNSQIDVVFPSSDFLGREIPAGVYQKLNRELLTNWGNLDTDFLKHLESVDPENLYAAPYMRGTSGIVYSAGEVAKRLPDAPVDSWDLVFDPEIVSRFADCGVFIMDAPGEVVSAALNYVGKDPNSVNSDDLALAINMLSLVRPYVRHFNSSQIINDLANGEMCIAVTYSGDGATAAIRAEEAGRPTDLVYSIPREGAELWFDVMAIPVDAPHPENAHLFINYLLRPEVIADVTNYVYYANAISSSEPFISDEIRLDSQIYPADKSVSRLFTLEPHSQDFIRLRNRAWTKFILGE